MKIAYIICRTIVNIVFIALAVYLSLKTNNFHFLWFLVVPIVSHLCGIKCEETTRHGED